MKNVFKLQKCFFYFIRKWKIQDQIANLGQCFIALDPKAFTDGFEDRCQVDRSNLRFKFIL